MGGRASSSTLAEKVLVFYSCCDNLAQHQRLTIPVCPITEPIEQKSSKEWLDPQHGAPKAKGKALARLGIYLEALWTNTPPGLFRPGRIQFHAFVGHKSLCPRWLVARSHSSFPEASTFFGSWPLHRPRQQWPSEYFPCFQSLCCFFLICFSGLM